MPATTTDIETQRGVGKTRSYGVAEDEIIYTGTLVCLDGDGYAVDGANTVDYRFAGIAAEPRDATGYSDAVLSVLLWTEDVHLLTFNGSATVDDIGKHVYLVDNQTVGLLELGSAPVYVGVIEAIESATKVWVRIKPLAAVPSEADLGITRTIQVAGVNATDFDLSSEAANFGGSDFAIAAVEDVEAFVTSTAASDGLRVVTTDWTLASGVLTAVNDESLNTWRITFRGYLLP